MRYPKHSDAYPDVYSVETDAQLPKKPDNRTRYMYFKTIAKGGTCIISSCKDLHLRRTVCHKALRPEIADDPIEQKRFLREARVTAMLQHPNTIPTYELGRDHRGHCYFTMKLVHGLTLREIIDKCVEAKSHQTESFNLVRLIEILVQVCHALHYAHGHGVIHRDIKPENILVGAFGEVLLLDWGMAKVWKDDSRTLDEEEIALSKQKFRRKDLNDESIPLTIRRPLQGTPPYMSPEQLESPSGIDHRTDIYSAGTVLFEVLALQRMIPGETVLDVLEKIKTEDHDAPSQRNPSLDIPSELENICMKCIAFDPDERYSSTEMVINDLEQWLHPARVL